MEFMILGPVGAFADGQPLPLGGPKPRALLAILLLHANEVVARGRLIDGIWGDAPPASAGHTLDDYVSRLRKTIGSDRIERRSPGYVLRVDEGELDCERFLARHEHGRVLLETGEPEAAARELREALELWHGAALADLRAEPFAAVEADRLDEQRLLALEDRIDADLALGRAAELVPELERLATEHPYRERLTAQLVLALYRSGRQVEALATYRRQRSRLVSELGLEPGLALRDLERSILAHDPALQNPLPPNDPREPIATARRRRYTIGAATLAAVVISTAAAGAWWIIRGDPSVRVGPATDDRVVGLDASSGRVEAAVTVSHPVSAVAADGETVWLGDAADESVHRLTASPGTIGDTIRLGVQPSGMAVAGGAVWVAATVGGTVTRIDPTTNSVTQRLRPGAAGATNIAAGPGGLWVSDVAGRALIRIDPRSGTPLRTLRLGFAPGALAVGRTVWVADYDAGTVAELDGRSGTSLGVVNVGQGPSAVTLGEGAVWVANSLDGTVTRIDPRTHAVVATIPVGNTPAGLALSNGSIWVAIRYSGSLMRISPGTNRIAQRVRIGGHPSEVSSAGGRLWVASDAATEFHRGGTLVLATTDRFGTSDPALYQFALSPQFTGLAYDTLVTFQHAAGPAGLRLVPDLAVALPRPTDRDTTYAFVIRRGIRYSDGRRLLATDFRRAIERLFRSRSPGASEYLSIRGAPACVQTPWQCDLSPGIVADDSHGTIVFRLRHPDPDFLYELTIMAYTAPVPPGVGDPAHGTTVPGTGPYRIAAETDQEVRFERNPNFQEWSHAAQPAGNPDTVVWRFYNTHAAVVRAVQAGDADWTFDVIPAAMLRRLELRAPSQLHATPWFLFQYAPLNTSKRPFDDVRVRKALNYAIDRSRIVGMYGGRQIAAVSCQPLVPGLPGYRRYCPYTRRPGRNGMWRAPDLARARALVAASGTRGTTIDVSSTSDSVGIPAQLPAYFAAVLRSLGYRTTLSAAPVSSFTEESRAALQISVDGDWLPDYPSASSYMIDEFGCHGRLNPGYYCDPALDAEMARAKKLSVSDPARSAALWQDVDRRIVDAAWWVPFAVPRGVDLVSARVRGYSFHPVWGFMADQAWLQH